MMLYKPLVAGVCVIIGHLDDGPLSKRMLVVSDTVGNVVRV